MTAGTFPRVVISPNGRGCCCGAYGATAYNTTGIPHSFHTVHTKLLPFLDQATVYNLIDMSLRYDDPINAAAVRTKISVFICPSDNRLTEGSTLSPHNYPAAGSQHPYGLCGLHGASGVFAERNGQLNEAGTALTHPIVRLKHIVDGTSNTIVFSEFAQNRTKRIVGGQCVPYSSSQAKGGWAKPQIGNTAYAIRDVSTPNGCNGTSTGGSNSGIARSWHAGGVHALALDGSVHFISDSIDGNIWYRIHTFNDQQVVSIP
jgi:hypothetical protein